MQNIWLGFLIVFIGGGLGAIIRHSINLFFQQKQMAVVFPWATLSANFIGSFLLGIIFVLCVEKQILGENWRLFIAIGFAGSLTTFSTFSLEVLQFLEKGKLWFAFLNILSNLFFDSTCFMARFFILTFFTTKLNYGERRIRTFEGNADRFTVCSLWPLGHLP